MWMKSTWFYSSSARIPDKMFRVEPAIPADKKAPRTFQPKTPRQPSPRTAKLLLDTRFSVFCCKRHFGNRVLPECGRRREGGTSSWILIAIAVSARFDQCRKSSRVPHSRLRFSHAGGRRTECRQYPP